MRALEKCFARFRGAQALRRVHGRRSALSGDVCHVRRAGRSAWQRPAPVAAPLPHPHSPEVTRFRRARAKRVRFHMWLQWLLDEQLARRPRIALVGDLAVGVDPGGADAWMWQDLFAPGMSVGAPPDEFNTLGQNWGLLPARSGPAAHGRIRTVHSHRPLGVAAHGRREARSRDGSLSPLLDPRRTQTERRRLRALSALDLLGIVALESVRAQAFVVGEDLGTVEDEVRAELAFRKLLSYRVLWFESKPPIATRATRSPPFRPTICRRSRGSGRDPICARKSGSTWRRTKRDARGAQVAREVDRRSAGCAGRYRRREDPRCPRPRAVGAPGADAR